MAKQFLCKVIGHDYDISIVEEVGGSLRVVADQCTRCGHTTRSLRPEAIIQAIRPTNDKYGRIHTDGSRSGGQPVVDNAMLEALQKDAGIPHLPTRETYQFRMAVSGEGPLAYQWSDKPHRLLYDACSIIEREAAEIETLRHDLERQMTIANEHVNEVERLLAALEQIAFSGADGPYGHFGEALNEHQMRRVARAAYHRSKTNV